ncbi:molybdopterin-dependent oxidoreductase [Variovorax sp. V116]|uniref:molybdopterin-dependent oxidoreductase n=1 Tax=Variovorax sp. V116 TaxID=3065953 RepID=UPI0034E8EE7B
MSAYWSTGVDLPNLQQPALARLTDFVTPLEHVFFLRHMAMPEIDRASWRLAIGGLVEHELSLSLADLEAMPQTEICAVHECAGHPLHPTVPVRRVANVVWRGVRLSEVLKRACVAPDARFVWSYGADKGDYHGVDIPAYVKDMPVSELHGEAMLATHMNSEPLSDKHGGPVRLVVPGFYGTNSTKWLVRLALSDTRSPGYFTTVMYNDRVVKDGLEQLSPVWRVAPHAVMVQPAEQARLPPGKQKIVGWAWGADAITRVEVSTDAGASWADAQLDARKDHAWQRFEFEWTPPSLGTYQLRCRAFDSTGLGQPEHGVRNAVFSISVTVE